MITRSPFSLNRFELEDEHIYFLPTNIFPVLQDLKSVVLRGSRGTGKTTLLKALNWKEQTSNISLRQALNGDFVSRNSIGVYLKLTLAPILPFRTWPNTQPHLQGTVFSTYLDLLWMEPLFEALADLTSQRILPGRTRSEQEACSAILTKHGELLSSGGKNRWSFGSLKDLIRSRRNEMELLALTNASLDEPELSRRFPLPHFGELGRTTAAVVSKFCSDSVGTKKTWHMKVCLDESECLDGFQQRVINTAIRLTDSSLSYVLAFVGGIAEPINTLIPGISLQRADREIIDLDPPKDDTDRLDDNFVQLAEGVCRARIRSVAPDAAAHFSTRELLGDLDINNLLLSILRTSENPQARAVLAQAEKLQTIYGREGDGEVTQADGLPIYQAYIIDRLKLRSPARDDPKDRRKQDSAELRKRMVAAYLCLCAELGKQVRYAYADMVLQASDRCIRDYLWQMEELFQLSGLDIVRFCSSSLPLDQQDAALRSAAKNKRDYIELAGIAAPTETLRLIEALGRLTARLQTAVLGQRGLRSSERGIFKLEPPEGPVPEDSPLKIIAEAAEAGFLKIIEQRPLLRFRVHCSLAAYYGFSYRGAYYDTPVRLSDLSSLISQPDDERLEAEIKRIESWLGTDASADLPLFQEPA
jgi:hypothetical protein